MEDLVWVIDIIIFIYIDWKDIIMGFFEGCIVFVIGVMMYIFIVFKVV